MVRMVGAGRPFDLRKEGQRIAIDIIRDRHALSDS